MIEIRLMNSDGLEKCVLPLESLNISNGALNENLQHQEINIQVKLEYDSELFDFLVEYESLHATVYDDKEIIFTGITNRDLSWADNGFPLPIENITITIDDNTYLLKQEAENEIAYIGKTLNYIIESICNLCEVKIQEELNLRNVIVDAFILDAGETYLTALENLLFQYGYSFIFNEKGEFTIVDLNSVDENLISITEDDFYTNLQFQKTNKNYSGVKVIYNDLIKKENEQVYWQGNGLNDLNHVIPITILPGQYYPYESDPIVEESEGQVFQSFENGYAESYTLYNGEKKYRRSSKTTLVYTENHHVIEDWEGILTINRTQFGAKQASVRFYNESSKDVELNQFAIRADAYYRSDDVILTYGKTEHPFEYQAEYIYNEINACWFSEFISKFFVGSGFKITGRASFPLKIGEHVKIDTGLSGFTCNAIVINCEYNYDEEIYKLSFLTYGKSAVLSSRYKKYSSNYGNFSLSQAVKKSISTTRVLKSLSETGTEDEVAVYQGKVYIWNNRRWNISDSSYYLGVFESTPAYNLGAYFLLSKSYNAQETLYVNGKKLATADGRLFTVQREYKAGYIYECTVDGWRLVKNKSDYRYVIAMIDSYQSTGEVPTVIEKAISGIAERNPNYLGARVTDPEVDEVSIGDYYLCTEETENRKSGYIYEYKGMAYDTMIWEEKDPATNSKMYMGILDKVMEISTPSVGAFSTLFANILMANSAIIQQLQTQVISLSGNDACIKSENYMDGGDYEEGIISVKYMHSTGLSQDRYTPVTIAGSYEIQYADGTYILMPSNYVADYEIFTIYDENDEIVTEVRKRENQTFTLEEYRNRNYYIQGRGFPKCKIGSISKGQGFKIKSSGNMKLWGKITIGEEAEFLGNIKNGNIVTDYVENAAQSFNEGKIIAIVIDNLIKYGAKVKELSTLDVMTQKLYTYTKISELNYPNVENLSARYSPRIGPTISTSVTSIGLGRLLMDNKLYRYYLRIQELRFDSSGSRYVNSDFVSTSTLLLDYDFIFYGIPKNSTKALYLPAVMITKSKPTEKGRVWNDNGYLRIVE